MYRAGYAEVLDDDSATARLQERRAFDHAIALLVAAQKRGRKSREATEAVHFVTRLWSMMLEDLASTENGLPQAMRANLISIGIWVLKEAERIRQDESDNFAGLIEINESIRGGLT